MGETIIYRQLCFKNGELVHKEIVEITKLRLLEIHGTDQGIAIWIPSLKGKTFGTFYICEHRKGSSGFYFGRHAMQGLSQEAYENGFTYVEDSVECAKIIANKIKESL